MTIILLLITIITHVLPKTTIKSIKVIIILIISALRSCLLGYLLIAIILPPVHSIHLI